MDIFFYHKTFLTTGPKTNVPALYGSCEIPKPLPLKFSVVAAVSPAPAAAMTQSDRHFLFRIPLAHFLADFVHAVNALVDEFLIFPAVFEDVIEDAPDHRDVGARTQLDMLVGMGRRPREAGIDDDEGSVVLLLRLEDMQHRDRMRFRRVAAESDDRLRLVHVREP